MINAKFSANFADTMFPDEFDALMADQDSPLAVLPVGSVEWFGPQMLLGCDGYVAMALADMTAAKAKGVLFPMLPYAFIGGLRPYAGTMDMTPYITGRLMEQVCLGILKQGFKRLMIVNCHGGGSQMVHSVARSVYKQTKLPVIPVFQSSIYFSWFEVVDIWKKHGVPYDWTIMSTNSLAGALAHMGCDKLVEKVMADNAACYAQYGAYDPPREVPSLAAIRQFGSVGSDDMFKAKLSETLSVEGALEVMDFLSDKLAWVAQENV